MKPVKFKEQNVVMGEGQSEYFPLPAHRTQAGEVYSKWRLSFRERISVLLRGHVWFIQWTFNSPKKTVNQQTHKPFKQIPKDAEGVASPEAGVSS